MPEHDELFAPLRAEASRTGIFLDFDGTLSPIVDRPQDAVLVDGATGVLEALVTAFGVVAIVSGRSLEDLKQRIKVRGLLLAGSYGRERSDRPQRRATEGWETVAMAAMAGVLQMPGVVVEQKGAGVALHYRNAPEHEDAVREFSDVLAREFALEIRPGRMVSELVVPGPGKGDAVARIVAERDLVAALAAGDDVADREAFQVVREMVPSSVVVGVSSDEVPEDLAASADVTVSGPGELVELLSELAGA